MLALLVHAACTEVLELRQEALSHVRGDIYGAVVFGDPLDQ
jgi:hypothetical protein